ncbi:MAG: site-specific integrase [Candidatus Eremiobacteraeota bacterium]|nr:site-specific integrase [Candidatus Eremiobacteraeota bacterium]MBC5822631.1 site-specific integrase [Candidatus Eremiobacteraeota bacterium]
MTALAVLDAPGPLSTDLLVARAQEYARSSQAASTRRAYASDLRDFDAFCAQHGERSYPAEPQTIALYVAASADRVKVATIRRRLAAISVRHRRAGLESPCSHRIVREVVSGIAREKGTAPRRVDAATLDVLRPLLLAVRGDDLAAKRDRAIILLGFAAALRRSELAALRLEDLRFSKRGLLVRITRSKTDQEGSGAEIAVPHVENASLCAVRAVRAWIDAAGIVEGPLFRSLTPHRRVQVLPIQGRDVANLVQRLARRARLDGDFSGHSLRAGFVTAAAQAKVPLDVIMRTTRHRSLAVLTAYIRRGDAFEAPALSSIIA